MLHYRAIFPDSLQSMADRFIELTETAGISSIQKLQENSIGQITALISTPEALALQEEFLMAFRSSLSTIISELPLISETEVELRFSQVTDPNFKPSVQAVIDRLFRRAIVSSIIELTDNSPISNEQIIEHFGDPVEDREFYDIWSAYFLQMAQIASASGQVEYRVIVKVDDGTNDLAGAFVRLKDDGGEFVSPASASEIREFGVVNTNENGFCDFLVSSARASVPLTIEIFAPGADLSSDTALAITAPTPSTFTLNADTTSFDVSVDYTPTSVSNSATISDVVAQETGIRTAALSALEAHYGAGASLLNIRLTGGASNTAITGDITDTEKALIDSYAMMEVINPNIGQNNVLINHAASVGTVGSIAAMSQTQFIASVSAENVGSEHAFKNEAEVGQVYAAAASVQGVLNSVLTDTQANFRTSTANTAFASAIPNTCNCKDCESGVSPLAYLADLTNYTLNHVNNNGNLVTLTQLLDQLHQDIANLPTSCEEMDNQLCQARVMVEVLIGYFTNRTISTTSGNKFFDPAHSFSTAFDTDLANYRKQAYELFLNYWGTSSEEIRRIHAEPVGSEKRQRLANKLGIQEVYDEGGSGEDNTLDRLRLIDFAASNADTYLEEILGIRRFNRVGLNEAPVPRIEDWKQAKLREIWHELDHFKDQFHGPNASYPVLDPDIVIPDDLRIPKAGYLPYDIWKNRKDTLTNFVEGTTGFKATANHFKEGVFRGTSSFLIYNDNLTDDLEGISSITIDLQGGGTEVHQIQSVEFANTTTLIHVQGPIVNAAGGDSFTLTAKEEVVTTSDNSGATLVVHVDNKDLTNELSGSDVVTYEDSATASISLTITSISFNYQEQRTQITFSTNVTSAVSTAAKITYDRTVSLGGMDVRNLGGISGTTGILDSLTTNNFSYILSKEFDIDVSSTNTDLIVSNINLEDFIVNGGVNGVDLFYTDNSTFFTPITTVASVSLSGGNTSFVCNNLGTVGTSSKKLRVVVNVTPWSGQNVVTDFSATGLIQQLTQGNSQGVDMVINAIQDNYKLTVDSFRRLYELKQKHEFANLNYSNPRLTTEEWAEVDSILLSAIKKDLFAWWIKEEQLETFDIRLNPQDFVVPLQAPTVGISLPDYFGQQPLIDPDNLERKGLPDFPVDGYDAVTSFYDTRGTELQTSYSTIKINRESQGVAYALQQVWGSGYSMPANVPDLETLRNNLSSSNAFLVDQALSVIDQEYHLELEAFELVMVVKAASENVDPSKWPTNEQYQEFYQYIVYSDKIRNKYSTWLAAESTLGHYQLLKGAMVKWQAAPSVRVHWETALSNRSDLPIIDPDIIAPIDLAAPSAGNALSLWVARRNDLAGLRTAIENSWTTGNSTQLQGFQDAIDAYLGILDIDFLALKSLEENGEDISIWVERLNLTYQEFCRLSEVRALCASTPPTAGSAETDEIEEVYDILLQVTKRRRFAIWKDEEADGTNGVDHTQDYFQIPEPELATFLPTDPFPIVKWRYNDKIRRDWQKKLESRVDQEAAALEGVQLLIEQVEDVVLKQLRDALIRELPRTENTNPAADKPAAGSFESLADWTHDRFLIDSKNNCCHKTNRISMAIEVLQGLVWGLRTDILENDTSGAPFHNWRLEAPNFEEEWKWVGTYGSWRAAVFVFLYPENLLIPALRRQNSDAFAQTLEEVQYDFRFTQDKACEQASSFPKYLRDIASMTVVATVQDRVSYGESTHCGETTGSFGSGTKYWHYFFGQASSGKAYWTWVDSQDSDQYTSMRDWKLLPPLAHHENGIALVGASTQDNGPEEKYIVVFYTEHEDLLKRLKFLKFNRVTGEWDDEATELNISVSELKQAITNYLFYRSNIPGHNTEADTYIDPIQYAHEIFDPTREAIDNFKIDIVQSSDNDGPIYLTLTIWGFIFTRRLSRDLDGWAKGTIFPVWVLVALPQSQTNASGSASLQGAVLTMGTGSGNDNDNRYITFLYRPVQNRFLTADWKYGKVMRVSDNSKHNDGYVTDFTSYLSDSTSTVFPWSDASFTWFRGARYIFMFLKRNGIGWAQNRIEINNGDFVWAHHNTVPPIVPKATISGLTSGSNRWLAGNAVTNTTNQNVTRLVRFRYKRSGGFIVMDPASEIFQLKPHLMGHGIGLRGSFTSLELEAKKVQMERIFTHNTKDQANVLVPAMHLDLIQEAFYHFPMLMGSKLSESGDYDGALGWFKMVYDWSQEEPDFKQDSNRKIWHGLVHELSTSNTYQRANEWLLDPLNPHSIAATRAFAYNKYTIITIVKTMIDYADSLYTMDTAETVPKARLLYEQALDLIGLLKRDSDDCSSLLNELDITLDDGYWNRVIRSTIHVLGGISDVQALTTARNQINTILAGTSSDQDKAIAIVATADSALATAAAIPANTISQALTNQQTQQTDATKVLLTDNQLNESLVAVSESSRSGFTQNIQSISGYSDTTFTASHDDEAGFSWLADTSKNLTVSGSSISFQATGLDVNATDPVYPTATDAQHQYFISNPISATLGTSRRANLWVPPMNFSFCIPDNPVISSLCLKAELNLFKIRHCMNIAGLVREINPFAAPTDTSSGLPTIGAGGTLQLPGTSYFRPTPYRFSVLLERSKLLTNTAQQFEAAFLAALEKQDQEQYNKLRAQQELEMAKGQVKLQDMRVKEAESGVSLANLQQERSQLQVEGLDLLINGNMNQYELAMISYYETAAAATTSAIYTGALIQASQIAAQIAGSGGGATAPGSVAAAGAAAVVALSNIPFQAGEQAAANQASTNAQIASIYASLERRRQDWEFQKSLAEQDVRVGQQQVKVAQDRVRVVGQERVIANLQLGHSEATVDFLANKFTNVELYQWMSRELERIYQFFLQEASATAKLAELQLAFERHEASPSFIQGDYWSLVSDDSETDRKGLTASGRLLQDIQRLDQFAFETDKPKLQISKTISLASLSPFEFQQFKKEGILSFTTPMELFDRDFPGHYMRLVKEVEVSLIALVPPTEGIKATLSNSGLSRVVIGGDIFQSTYVKRDPEMIVLNGTQNTNGVYEMRADDKFYKPFEGIGVDTSWELRLEKAANQFDFSTIADAIITVRYEALNSFEHRARVINEIGSELGGDLALSFKNNLPDQWYDLNNPDLVATDMQMKVHFETNRNMFPPNLESVKVAQVLCYFVFEDESQEISFMNLHFDEGQTLKGGYTPNAPLGGEAVPNAEGYLSTRSGSAATWIPIIGKSVNGVWEMSLPNTTTMKNYLADEQLVDILMVITYEGDAPAYNL